MFDYTKINYNLLSPIEKTIFDNDIVSLKKMLNNNITIYNDKSLCSGNCLKHTKTHPTMCCPFICYKTLVYYGLWMNTLLQSYIFKTIIDILNNDNYLYFGYDQENSNISYIKNIFEHLISTDCCCKTCNNYKIFYDHNDNNCYKTFEILSKNIPNLLEYLSTHYDECKTDTNIYFEIKCYKNDFGKIHIDRQLSCDEKKMSIYSQKLYFYWNKYLINYDILKILFSQQAYEYYNYNLLTNQSNINIIFDNIISNPLIDINYESYSKHNIMSLSMTIQEDINIIDKIINNGGKFPIHFNVSNILNDSSIKNIKYVFENYDNSFFTDCNLLSILNNKSIVPNVQIELFDILLSRNCFDKNNELISFVLNCEISFELLEKIAKFNNLISRSTTKDLYTCINLLKYKELNILLKFNSELINDNQILHYFLETNKTDTQQSLLLIKTLLYYSPKLEIKNANNDTPLLSSIKTNRNELVYLLYNAGSNPFEYDSDGYNSFHIAINMNNVPIIHVLKKSANFDLLLINSLTQHDKLHPLILSINSSNSLEISKILLNENGLDCNYKLPNGNNILHYLIESNLNDNIKTILFKNFITKDFNLLESCVIEKKPLIVNAVEKNYYNIVVMIMNKLLEKNEIKFEGYNNVSNIMDVVDEKKKNIIVKNKDYPNFYSLVMVYLENEKINQIKRDNNKFTENMFIFIIVIVLYHIASNKINRK